MMFPLIELVARDRQEQMLREAAEARRDRFGAGRPHPNRPNRQRFLGRR